MNSSKIILIISLIFCSVPIHANACCINKSLDADPIISAWIKADQFAKNGSRTAARNRDVIFTFLNEKQLFMLQKYINKEINSTRKKFSNILKKDNVALVEETYITN